ncbi:Ubiquinone/menaquinone biosynthesis methyltransferase [Wickerhamomyces ciferrii]|uniref:Ubiquinone/menaquinone biosynthesis methyltransferase n=1 Tax=Wickerhamomyces ciferrii (strain ATCC 14091 / BCRC 22168 / CBS 111 / JCM 3599 / NBRC 0793 / NRRL Y-1031 F-60-10) TaxID=1206466 RepID=K0KPL1_WICCF|nr:Ubiquinone/menaquinone biosynthesis methyltransferase [Wickerhamomyces ciferrii]CCH43098.1 Ubiquinone/menaquinone biosynthesis methyltransferase [Wickerhamomyces ciferrii]
MSAYSDTTFRANDYNSFRPTYSNDVFKFINQYHTGGHDLAVDLGCGPGQASYPLTEYFKKVIGTDLSQTMINAANGKRTDEYKGKIEFRQSPGESLSFLEDNSVDLFTAAQCVHWFDHDNFFKEINRVLKPGGTLAYWGYVDPVFNVPEADKIVDDYTYEDPTKLGPYWEPGRFILRKLLKDVQPPQELFDDIKVYEDKPGVPSSQQSPLQIKREIPLEFYQKYVQTWSSYHSWKKANPDAPDVSDQLIEELKAKVKWNNNTKVNIQWLTVLKLARKRLK